MQCNNNESASRGALNVKSKRLPLPKRPEKRTRAEKHQDTLNALISAAIEVVGNEGYAAASVTKITAHAQIANGTFYNYFENRQDLFDQLLPLVGDRLIEHIRSRVDRATSGLEREKLRISAYVDFLRTTPGFIRIFHEAEVYAPRAYQQHMDQYYKGYVQALKKSISRKELGQFSDQHIDVLSYLLMGMQDFMGVMLHRAGKRFDAQQMVDVYLRLIGNGGLFTDKHEPAFPTNDRERKSQ